MTTVSQSTSTDIVDIVKPRKHKKIVREIVEATSTTTEHETVLKPKKYKRIEKVLEQSSSTVVH